MDAPRAYGFATRAIHVGQDPEPATGAVTVPIYATSTFAQQDVGVHKGWEYSRSGNPTRAALETCFASLEASRFGLAFASGLASTDTILHLLQQGDHVVCMDDVYGGTRRLFTRVLERHGLCFSYVDASRIEALEEALTPRTKLVWVESPTNPLMKLVDIAAVSKLAHARGARVAVDNTFMSPYFQRPLELGADFTMHSATKYIGGHSDVVSGLVAVHDQALFEELKYLQNAVGGVPSPFDCFLLLRGLKTLAVRMRQHERNALAIARYLSGHPRVRRVNYPGLETHTQHELAKRQTSGHGGMLSFEIEGGAQAARRVVQRTKLFFLAESLGGVESLVELPALMTHASIPPEIRRELGIDDGLIRLSVGIEETDDLLADLEEALA